MNKKIWDIELKEDDCCWISPTGVIIDIDCKYTARVSYKKQIIDIYMKNYKQHLEYRISLLKGYVWGPGILSQMSHMVLKFVPK